MSNPASATTTGEFSLKGTYSLLAQWLVLSLSLEQPSAGAGDTELCSCLPLPGRGGCIYAEPPGLRSRGRTKPGTHLAKSLRSFPLRSLRSLPRLPYVLGPHVTKVPIEQPEHTRWVCCALAAIGKMGSSAHQCWISREEGAQFRQPQASDLGGLRWLFHQPLAQVGACVDREMMPEK